MNSRYKILYTHQKQKKKKTWQDGYLDLSGKKARVLSDELKELDSLFIKPNEVCDDAELESDRYLITVECLFEGGNNNNSGGEEQQGKENTAVRVNVHTPPPQKQFGSFVRHPIKKPRMKPLPVYPIKPLPRFNSNNSNAVQWSGEEEPLHPSLSMQAWSGDPRNPTTTSRQQHQPTAQQSARHPPPSTRFGNGDYNLNVKQTSFNTITSQSTYTPRFSNNRPPPRHKFPVQNNTPRLPVQNNKRDGGRNSVVQNTVSDGGRCKRSTDEILSLFGDDDNFGDDDDFVLPGNGDQLPSLNNGTVIQDNSIDASFDDAGHQNRNTDFFGNKPKYGGFSSTVTKETIRSSLSKHFASGADDDDLHTRTNTKENISSNDDNTSTKSDPFFPENNHKYNKDRSSESIFTTKRDPFFPNAGTKTSTSSFAFNCFPAADPDDENEDHLLFPSINKKTGNESVENRLQASCSMSFFKNEPNDADEKREVVCGSGRNEIKDSYFLRHPTEPSCFKKVQNDPPPLQKQNANNADYLLSLFTQSNTLDGGDNEERIHQHGNEFERWEIPQQNANDGDFKERGIPGRNTITFNGDFETRGNPRGYNSDCIEIDDDDWFETDDMVEDDFIDGDFVMTEEEDIFGVSEKKRQVITIEDDEERNFDQNNLRNVNNNNYEKDLPSNKKRSIIYPDSNRTRPRVQPSHQPNPPPSKKQFTGGFSAPEPTQTRGGGFSAPTRSYGNALYKFPEKDDVTQKPTPKRVIPIPVEFESVTSYKLTFKSVLNEHINIILFELAGKYHNAIGKADVTAIQYGTITVTSSGMTQQNTAPKCSHGPSRMNAVRKEGKNKGRLFYACANMGGQKCNFFQWADEVKNENSKGGEGGEGTTNTNKTQNKVVLKDYNSTSAYFNSYGIQFYYNVKFLLKVPYRQFFKGKKGRGGGGKGLDTSIAKKVMYISLANKKASSFYNKDDIWIVSKSLDFPLGSTFIAKSVFYGPKSSGELEISPLCSYSSPNWRNNELCYAIQAFNASTELTCLDNLENFLNVLDVPVLPSILSQSSSSTAFRSHITSTSFNLSSLPQDEVLDLVESTAASFSLNTDQQEALSNIGRMFMSGVSHHVTLIHGVFGAGKSYLLSVVVLFLVQLFEVIEARFQLGDGGIKLKLMISSITNVAVDRVLIMLLEHGFEEFIRIGSVKKIAKRILPHSVHACDKDDQELQELNELMATEITEEERGYVRKAIELHKLGVNRNKLSHVRVVGVTCAASVFPFLQQNEFQVQLQDECSQMMEPISLLPIARFKCQRLILVGDPKQLSPTIQGSESEQHVRSLELTLFERLEQLGYQISMLRTQYRCHPSISVICNEMFYGGQLKDGITADQREPIFDWLPTLSVIDCDDGREENGMDGSYFNLKEADVTVKLLAKILQCDKNIDPNQVGVITQYKAQVWKINSLLRNIADNTAMKSIQISTVDAFQGAEKDVIILSCVRTRHIGFIDCRRRTNVALSRAKKHLVIVGKMKLLQSNTACWGGVLNVCKTQNARFSKSNSFMKELAGS